MIWFLLAACTGPADSDKADDTAVDSGDDTGGEACALTATADLFVDPPTSVRVSWDRPLTDAVVRFGTDDTYGRSVPATDPQSVTIPFLGAGAEWHFQVEGADGAAPCVAADVSVRIPPAPAELPALIETVPWAGALDAPLLVTTVQGQTSAVVVVDREGRYAWWRLAPSQPGYARARLAEDGSGVWTLLEAQNAPAALVLEPWTGPSTVRVEAPYGHHDFAEINAHGDRLAWLVLETREIDGEQVVGDIIRVIDEDGGIRDVWNAFDQWEVVPNVGWEESTIAGAADWTHANTLRYLPDQDAFLVSLHFVPAVVLIGRDGELRWVFGEGPGVAGDFDFGAAGPPDQMHSPSITDAGLLLFENGNSDRRDSRVLEYAVDWDARTASPLWEAAPSEDAYTYVLGDAVRTADGSTLTTWGNLGLAEEFAADGTPTWKVNLGMGDIFGFLDTLPAPWIADAP